MKRLSTHSAGKGLGLRRVFALAACLLAVWIGQAVVVSEKRKFAGYNMHYDACVTEAIQASPNTNEESHIFFQGIVPRTFAATFVSELKVKHDILDDGDPETEDDLHKYLVLFMTKIMSDLDRDFTKHIAEKMKQLPAEFRGHFLVYTDPKKIPGCGATTPKSRDIFIRIVLETETYQHPMHDFIENLRKNCRDPNILDKVSFKKPLSEGMLSEVNTCIENYIEYLLELAKSDLIFTEFNRAVREKPAGTRCPQHLQSQAVAESSKGWFACHNNHYYDCINEAIQASRNMNEDSEKIIRAAVSEVFSDKVFLFAYINNLKKRIDVDDQLDDQTRLAVNDILLKYVDLLMMKIISDVEGTDFVQVVMEKWKLLEVDYGNHYQIYLRPWLIPGCRSTNRNSRKIFLDIVLESIEATQSMSNYIGDLRVNSEKAKRSNTDLDDKTRSDLDTIIERYIRYIEEMTQLDLLLEEFGRVFDDKSTGSPRRLQRLAVACSREEVFTRYNEDYTVFMNKAIEASRSTDRVAHEYCWDMVKETFSTNNFMENIRTLSSEILTVTDEWSRLGGPGVQLILFKFLQLLLTKTITDLKGEDFFESIAENWKHLRPSHGNIYGTYSNPEEIRNCCFTSKDSRKSFKNIVKTSFTVSRSMQEFINNLESRSKDANMPSDETRSDLDKIIINYVEYLENASKAFVLREEFTKLSYLVEPTYTSGRPSKRQCVQESLDEMQLR